VKRALSMMEALGIEGELIEHEVSGRTSEGASEALGVPLSRILKSLVFVERGRFVFVIISGDRRVSLKKLRSVSGLKRPRLARRDEILSLLGYEPGGIPPFAFYGILPCYIDRILTSLEWVVGSAGSEYVGVKLNPRDLVRIGCEPHEISERVDGP